MRMVAVNESGLRIGQDHQNAVLTDHEVELLLVLKGQGFGYKKLTVMFEISRTQVRRICAGTQRSQLAVTYRPATEKRKE